MVRIVQSEVLVDYVCHLCGCHCFMVEYEWGEI